jgi:chromosome partitioning protein
MRVFAVANQKGGVGKTTTAVTLAGLLSQRGYRTLMVDLDPHGSLTTYFGLDPDTLEHSVYTLFQNAPHPDPMSVVRATRFANLHLMPASSALATLDRQLGAREGMGLVLARALAQCSGHFDVAFVDCPPVLGVLMVNALAASHELLIPVQTEFLAMKGLERMLHTLGMILRARKRPLPYLVIPTMFDRRVQSSLESLSALRDRFPDVLWNSVIPVDTQFREASQHGAPLNYLSPQARGVIAYTALANHLLSQGESAARSAS